MIVKTKEADETLTSYLPPVDFETYTGPWNYQIAAHLLRRTTFGPTKALIEEAVNKGLEATIAALFEDIPLPGLPLNYFDEAEPEVALGEAWMDFPYYEDVNVKGTRRKSLRAWTMENIVNEGISIREKLTLFWHNHFPISSINDGKYLYRYSNTLRTNAWGNFRELVKLITIDPSMLRYLNGNTNTDNNPNENYARELLELFTIGKGPIAGPGDYTNYTEDDVLAIAKVLTGWDDDGYFSTDIERPMISYFRPERHETADKQLSHRFDNVIIQDAGEEEYKILIDIIFSKDEVAKFISRKLYRWFVYYKITDEVETEVITPMAQLIIDNNYELKPALMALFSSNHFFAFLNIGPMIASPLDYIMSMVKKFEIKFSDDMDTKYKGIEKLLFLAKDMEQEYYQAPDVAGWKAYYQEPLFYRTWINATTLGQRTTIVGRITTNGYGFNGFKVRIDPLWLLANRIEKPDDPVALIEELSTIIFPQIITEKQKTALKDILIPGLPDYEWGVEYNDYLADPENNGLRNSVENKLEELIKAMHSMPESYLI
jgi:uncharacterized protein (DUF1800 family)